MNNVKYIFFLASIITGNLFAQQPQKKYSLRQAVDTALKNNIRVSQSGIQAERDRINWQQAKSDLFPELNGNVSTGLNQGRSIDPFTNAYSNSQINYANYGINSGVVIFNGSVLRNTIRRNELVYQTSQLDWQQIKDNLSIDVILAFLQVLTNQDIVVQLRNQAQLTTQQVNRLNILNKEGAIAPSLLSDLEGQRATDLLAINSVENDLETSRIGLCRLMGVPHDANIQVEQIDVSPGFTPYALSSDSVYKLALEQFPQVKAAELRRQSAEKDIKIANGNLLPALTLNGSINTNYSNAATNDILLGTTDISTTDYVFVNGDNIPVIRRQKNFLTQRIPYGRQLNNNLFTSVSLNLRIPIFNNRQARNRIKLAKLNFKDMAALSENVKTELQLFVEQAWTNMQTAFKRFSLQDQQVKAYEESFRAAGVRFNAGIGNTVDYLTAKNNLDRARINSIVARYDFMLRSKVLDYYSGKRLID